MSERDLKWFVGLDGGGTSTTAAIASTDVLSKPHMQAAVSVETLADSKRTSNGPSNPLAVGQSEASNHIQRCLDGLTSAVNGDRSQIIGICAGVAGCDRPEQAQWLTGLLKQLAPQAHSIVDNDAMNVLWAATHRGEGIALIGGTGSLALAATPDGQRLRQGGWGYLLGDDGSGYWMGIQVLRKCCHMVDTGQIDHELIDALSERLDPSSIQSITAWTYASERTRSTVAELAEIVVELAGRGNPTCGRIVQEGANHLAALVTPLIAQCGETVEIACSGGLIVNSPLFRQLVQKNIGPHHALHLVVDPTLGALRRIVEQYPYPLVGRMK